MYFTPTLARLLTAALLAWTAAGCSSSGGSGGSQTFPDSEETPASTPSLANFDTAEYRENYGLDAINSISAYEAGLSGDGVTVAVIDTGIDRDHPDLDSNIHAFSTNIVTGIAADAEDADTTDGHGTAIAGIVAAKRNGAGMHGVAFNAKVLAIGAVDPADCTDIDCPFSQFALADGLDYARTHGAKVVNLSLGGAGPGPTLTAAFQRAVAAGMIVVIAAGNDSDTVPSPFASVAGEAWANGQMIIVGATNSANTVAGFSNQAGASLKDVFVVAPGVNVITTGLGGGYVIASGTSFSAPHVAGAAAILFENFPGLTAKEVAEILISTAQDLGAPGVDPVYGHGLIDLAAALEPIGVMGIAVDNASLGLPSSDLPSLTESGIVLSRAFGDALGHTPGLMSVMGLDSYRRSYRVGTADRILTAATTPDLAAISESRRLTEHQELFSRGGLELQAAYRWDRDLARWAGTYLASSALSDKERPEVSLHASFALHEDLAVTADYRRDSGSAGADSLLFSHVNAGTADLVAQQGTAIGLDWQPAADLVLTTTFGTARLPATLFAKDEARITAFSAELSYAPAPIAVITARAGAMAESGSVLGARSSGGLSLADGARTLTGGLRAEIDFGPVAVYADGELGRTVVDSASQSLFRDLEGLRTGRFSAGLKAAHLFDQSDRFIVAFAQPLRIEGGAAVIRTVTGRDYSAGRLIYNDVSVPLAPTGRELDISLGYALSPNPWGRLRLQALRQFDAGHQAGVSATTILLDFTQAF